jgi:hypothetical protein
MTKSQALKVTIIEYLCLLFCPPDKYSTPSGTDLFEKYPCEHILWAMVGVLFRGTKRKVAEYP